MYPALRRLLGRLVLALVAVVGGATLARADEAGISF
jgi:hypothetical protein